MIHEGNITLHQCVVIHKSNIILSHTIVTHSRCLIIWLSVERPCARAVKVDSPCPLAQICARGGVVWALTEQRAIFYREGLSTYCAEGEQWKYDTITERQSLEPVCIALGEQGTAWVLDTTGRLWFRTGVTVTTPQGQDQHWWQV
ncbi:hypothetical protein AAFF_G00256250 [Aldrovandia affinis]|uniref:Uncharacterized protein n=1 Tax=Aldrovandia affinis TaxID=143900 RepID=A0AAD7RC46_9TELE|nr:hypothetical protein AAFF_G00256250 [Aldrovandia affinis]